MKRNLIVGILREARQCERRVPLTPADVSWLNKRGIKVEIESSHTRIFRNQDYRKEGARVLDKIQKAVLLLGIKEPRPHELHKEKIYMLFSHTCKGQNQNMPLLKACLKKRITLLDYEKITDTHGRRLVYFGRFAGICGMVDSLYYLGKKLEWRGLENPFSLIYPSYKYESLAKLKQAMAKVGRRLAREGLRKEISPFIVGITGHGRVSEGAQEILDLLNPVEIHPKNMLEFVRHQKRTRRGLYKIVFLREEKFRSRSGRGFYFEEYLEHPERFKPNLDTYLPYLNLLVHASYWDSRYPRLVTKEMIHKLAGRRPFRLELIGDISCDVNGSIELTYKTATPDNSTFTYEPQKRKFTDGYESEGITILAVDNLPTELPRDASQEFSRLIREYVYQIAAHGAKDITHHAALPAEIRRAVITQNGKLTGDFHYLKQYI